MAPQTKRDFEKPEEADRDVSNRADTAAQLANAESDNNDSIRQHEFYGFDEFDAVSQSEQMKESTRLNSAADSSGQLGRSSSLQYREQEISSSKESPIVISSSSKQSTIEDRKQSLNEQEEAERQGTISPEQVQPSTSQKEPTSNATSNVKRKPKNRELANSDQGNILPGDALRTTRLRAGIHEKK